MFTSSPGYFPIHPAPPPVNHPPHPSEYSQPGWRRLPIRIPQPLKQRWYAQQDMTLCIGALALNDGDISPRIVLCFDYKVSNDYWGSEGEYKFRALGDCMVSLMAGSPARARELNLLYEEYLSVTTLTAPEAVEQLRAPLITLKRRLAESYVSRRLGFSYADFLANGEAWLGQYRRDQYISAIENHQPNVEMILAGFIGQKPVIYVISRSSGDAQLDVEICTNFCLIGSGAMTAEPALHSRGQSFNVSLSRTLYNVFEAKRIGEISPSVGQKSKMYVLSPPVKGSSKMGIQIVSGSGEKYLEGYYRRHRPKPIRKLPTIPPDALQTLE